MTKEQFKQARLDMGKTQEQWAEALGYSSRLHIIRKEKGEHPISRQDEIIINHLKALWAFAETN